jgi:PleD family two-component response regulator
LVTLLKSMQCRFTFTLPQSAAAKVASGARDVAPTNVSGPSTKPLVLIVDDDVAARELLASYLEREYRVALAESGAQALKKAQDLNPDAITLDVLMPGGSGFETLIAPQNQAPNRIDPRDYRVDCGPAKSGVCFGSN